MSDVMTRVRRADPTSETSRIFLSQNALWERFEELRDGHHVQTVDLSSPATMQRRPRWTAALATFLAILTFGVAGLVLGELTQSQPARTTEEDRALATVRDFFTALTKHDAAAASSLVHPNLLDEDPWIGPGLEFLAALPGMKTAEECTTRPEGSWTFVSCSMVFGGPLFVATSQDTKPGIMTVDESGLLTSRPALGFRSPVDRAFVDYATAVEPEAFAAVCGTDVYPAGSVQTGHGYSWTGACGKLWASLAEDAAVWIEEGKPPLTDAPATAIQMTEDFLDALSRGDAEGALALMKPYVAEIPTVAPVLEFVAALPASKTASDCTTSEGPIGIDVVCQIDFKGPLFEAMGQTRATGSFLVDDGLLAQPPDFGRRPDVDNVFVEYARLTEPEAFAEACSSGSYDPGTVRVDDDGYVFAGPCGELWALLAGDMAAWIRQGDSQLGDNTGR